MTKMHFEHAARIVTVQKTHHEKVVCAAAFAALFQGFNPRFDEDRFFKACGFDGVPEAKPRKK